MATFCCKETGNAVFTLGDQIKITGSITIGKGDWIWGGGGTMDSLILRAN